MQTPQTLYRLHRAKQALAALHEQGDLQASDDTMHESRTGDASTTASKTATSQRPSKSTLRATVQRIKQQLQESRSAQQAQAHARRMAVLQWAEVVVGTLVAVGSALGEAVRGRRPGQQGVPAFDAIVADEAAQVAIASDVCCKTWRCIHPQALEPASLIPLQFSSPTAPLVLVGDQQQLPATVLSSAALRRGLDQSLFARLQGSLPVTMLQEQHRMHPVIAGFAAGYFYQGMLRNAATVGGQHRSMPYHRFDWCRLENNVVTPL